MPQSSKRQPKSRRPSGDDGGLTPEEVEAWLRRNPDFLADRPDLACSLTPPGLDQGKGVVDFQRFVVERQRRELDELKASSKELLAAARSNKADQIAVHKAVLALLAASSFERAISVVTEDWSSYLDVDVVMMGVEAVDGVRMPAVQAGLTLLAPGDIDSRLGRMQDARAVAELSPPDPAMFGEAAGLARSVIWLRLGIHESVPPGVLALGSREPGRFTPRQNTELLRFLASSLAITIRAWLDLPEPTTVYSR